MRLFVALVPPDAAIAEMIEQVAPVRAELPDVRFLPAERMHLTLVFYGEVGDLTEPRLRGRLARAAKRFAPLTLHFASGGAFPRRRSARVLWAGLHGDTDRLTRLAASTNAVGRRIGIDVAERRYRPHLTLARLREPRDVSAQVERLADLAGTSWTATEIALVQSTLGPRPVYETLATFPFGPPPTAGSAGE